jgi:acyl carrier protein
MEQYTMTLDESTEAFRRVATLASGGQVVVSTGDLPARYNLWIKRDSLKALSAVEQAGKQALHPRPSISNAYVNPRNETEQKIAELWQEVLGIERIGVRDSFFDLGGHSLLATRLVGRLGNAFQTDVPLGKFFENPTIEGLAENILKMKSERNDQDRVRVLNLLAQLSEEEVDVELGKRALGTP